MATKYSSVNIVLLHVCLHIKMAIKRHKLDPDHILKSVCDERMYYCHRITYSNMLQIHDKYSHATSSEYVCTYMDHRSMLL